MPGQAHRTTTRTRPASTPKSSTTPREAGRRTIGLLAGYPSSERQKEFCDEHHRQANGEGQASSRVSYRRPVASSRGTQRGAKGAEEGRTGSRQGACGSEGRRGG